MSDAGDNLNKSGNFAANRRPACDLKSHYVCKAGCEVRQVAHLNDSLSAGQIKIGVITAAAGIVVSSVFAIGVLAVWVFHSLHGKAMPDVPLIVTSIASAPFAAGVITTLRIPDKVKTVIEGK